MAKRGMDEAILRMMAARRPSGKVHFSSAEIVDELAQTPSTVLRYLNRLKADGKIKQTGNTSASRWELLSGNPAEPAGLRVAESSPEYTAGRSLSASWSEGSSQLLASLQQPLGTRMPSSYQRHFVDTYIPNKSFLLPESLAHGLFQAGRMQGQQPAGTYARNVIAPLLIDLSFSSSKLEGNRYTKLDTEMLFQSGKVDPFDTDAIMLLNHKRAIEFLIDEIPLYGLSLMVLRNIHELLMQGLLHDENGLGTIRRKIVSISNTVYVPTHVPMLLEVMLQSIVDKACQIKNPVEAAFFLWVNIAYLQPFEDGNKRTSRISANVPLLMYNCAPLSFLDISEGDYCFAMMGVYEQCNVSLAADLFAWTYRRSIQKYATQIHAAGAPNPFRNIHRETIGTLVARVVRERQSLSIALAEVDLAPEDQTKLLQMVKADLARLGEHNFGRYRLTPKEVARWIDDGRPVIS